MAICWAGEILLHLEEVMFWLFLLNLTPNATPWFKSYYFKVWCASLIPVLLSLIVPVIRTGKDTLHADSVFRSAAASCDFVITLPFIWVVYNFDGWLEKLKKAGAAQCLIIRLYGFGELNKLRMAFRFLFIISNWMTSADGLTKAAPFNNTLWVVDTLSFLALIGYSVQAMLTMLIFFPRNHAKECGFESGQLSEDRRTSRSYPSEKIRSSERAQKKNLDVRSKIPVVQYGKKCPLGVGIDSSSSDKTLTNGTQTQSPSRPGKIEKSGSEVNKVPTGNCEKGSLKVHNYGNQFPDSNTTLTNKYAIIEVTQATSSDLNVCDNLNSRRLSLFKPAHCESTHPRDRRFSDSMKAPSEGDSWESPHTIIEPSGDPLFSSAGAEANERQSNLEPFQSMSNRSLPSRRGPDPTRLIHPAIRNYRSPIDVVGYSAEDEPEDCAHQAAFDT